jgi:hypothetical protein
MSTTRTTTVDYDEYSPRTRAPSLTATTNKLRHGFNDMTSSVRNFLETPLLGNITLMTILLVSIIFVSLYYVRQCRSCFAERRVHNEHFHTPKVVERKTRYAGDY